MLPQAIEFVLKEAAESTIAVRDVIEEDEGEIERREGADWGRMEPPPRRWNRR